MANTINLQELEQELKRTRAMFEQWSGNTLQRAQACKATHIAKLRASQGEIAELTQRYQRAEKQAAHVRQQMAQDTEHEQALQATADSLVMEQHALQKRLQQLQLELEAEAESVQQLQAEVTSTRNDLGLQMSKLDQLHNAYQNALGLTLVSRNGELCFTFTQIDPQQPGKPYGFAVKVIGDNEYQVTECDPELPGRQQLEQQLLGARADFAGFVRAMRKEFKMLAAATQP